MPEIFEAKVFLRGQEYFAKGQVLNIRLSDGLLKARVKGSSSHIYDVHMDLKIWPGEPARCTCPYQVNCKHAAACLFALHEKEKKDFPEKDPSKLDRKLETWLKNLKAQEIVQQKEEATHHLLYVLEFHTGYMEHKVAVKLAMAKLLKKSGYGKRAEFNTVSDSKKQFFTPEDSAIVAELMFRSSTQQFISTVYLRNSELLTKIIATGRAFKKEEDDALVLGPEKKINCEWVLQSDGTQSIKLTSHQESISPLLMDEPWYVDEDTNTLGLMKTPYSSAQLRYLLDAPSIPLEQAAALAKKMKASHPEFPQPIVYEDRQIEHLKPIPVLVLNTTMLTENYSILMRNLITNPLIYTAEIYFIYDDLRVSFINDGHFLVKLKNGILLEYQRDKVEENLRADQLLSYLKLRQPTREELSNAEKSLVHEYILADPTDSQDFTHLYQDSLPSLKNAGWLIEFASDAYMEIIDADEVEWFSELNDAGNDFFSYQLGISIDGTSVSIVPLVADLISKYSGEDLDSLPDEQLMKLPLGNGRYLQLALGRIKPLVRLLLQYGLKHVNHEQQNLQLSRYQLMLMRETEQAMAAISARWQGAEVFRKALMQLINVSELPEVVVPQGLKTQLRDYQQNGLSWLQFLRSNRMGGVLADDMGLGKTVQTLAHLQLEKEQGLLKKASLIIAPTSLMGNWQAEAAKFTPELRVLIFHGLERHEDQFDDYDLVISTYGLIQRDKARFLDYQFYYLILDEAQFIKNARTKTTQVIHQLQAQHRLCLTGTPMENHLGELWSLFHFLMPGLLGESKQFSKWFKTPIEKLGDNERRSMLVNRVKPFMLRRTKNQVAKELPPKTEITRTIALDGPQRDLYEGLRMSMEKKVRDAIAKQGLGKSHIVLLDALLKLRQICCDPRLLSLNEAKMAYGHSAKLDALMELLDNLMEEGRRVLVFSQFTSMLELIEEQLHLKQYPYLKLTGQTQNRQELVNNFQEGKSPLFLISLKAGGTGLNLTRADTVIHYDPWWNPAVEDQATDRSHRIGQENPVFVYKLITEGTVEQAILLMQQKKRELVNGVLASNTTSMVGLTEQDIEQFFMSSEILKK